MADWFNIADTSVDPDAPLTSELAYAWRDNPIAIAEGASGAPKNKGKSMDIDIGNLTGTTAIVDLDDAAKVLLVGRGQVYGTGSNLTASFGYQLSSNNGASWGSVVTLAANTIVQGGGGSPIFSSASGAEIVNMVGFNAIRLSAESMTGALFYLEGV